MNIQTLTLKGTAEWNEDALVVNPGVSMYGVLDGATSLHPFRGPNGETGGYLASRTIQQYLESLQAEDLAGIDLKEAIVQANVRLRGKMKEAGIDLTDQAALWTSALAVVRIHDRYIDYAQVGDCMIAATYADGTVRTVSRDQVAHIDYESKKIWEEALRTGVQTREELWELVKPHIRGNKSRMNTLGGYSVLSGQPEANDFIEYGRINRIQLQSILIVSDGLFPPKSSAQPPADGIGELVTLIEEKSLEGYAKWLMDLEAEDKECRKYPRFKVSDDKTAVLIRFDVE
ncbi:protein phosphatase 2C domain-containing protein [Paenibacillus elgii]